MLHKRRFNSANLKAICEAIQDEERQYQAMNQDDNEEDNKSDIEESKGPRPNHKKHSNLLAGGVISSSQSQIVHPEPRYASSLNVRGSNNMGIGKPKNNKSPKKKKKQIDSYDNKDGLNQLAEIPEEEPEDGL